MRSWDFGGHRIRISSKSRQGLVRTWGVSVWTEANLAAIEEFHGQS